MVEHMFYFWANRTIFGQISDKNRWQNAIGGNGNLGSRGRFLQQQDASTDRRLLLFCAPETFTVRLGDCRDLSLIRSFSLQSLASSLLRSRIATNK